MEPFGQLVGSVANGWVDRWRDPEACGGVYPRRAYGVPTWMLMLLPPTSPLTAKPVAE